MIDLDFRVYLLRNLLWFPIHFLLLEFVLQISFQPFSYFCGWKFSRSEFCLLSSFALSASYKLNDLYVKKNWNDQNKNLSSEKKGTQNLLDTVIHLIFLFSSSNFRTSSSVNSTLVDATPCPFTPEHTLEPYHLQLRSTIFNMICLHGWQKIRWTCMFKHMW